MKYNHTIALYRMEAEKDVQTEKDALNCTPRRNALVELWPFSTPGLPQGLIGSDPKRLQGGNACLHALDDNLVELVVKVVSVLRSAQRQRQPLAQRWDGTRPLPGGLAAIAEAVALTHN
jgi:hypothetical protein